MALVGGARRVYYTDDGEVGLRPVVTLPDALSWVA
jgi:hypothetical protein